MSGLEAERLMRAARGACCECRGECGGTLASHGVDRRRWPAGPPRSPSAPAVPSCWCRRT